MFSQWITRLMGMGTSQEEVAASADHQLLEAASEGDLQILVSRLHEPDSNINCTDPQGSTPLHLAVKAGHANCVDLLLKHPLTSLICKNRWGRTPAHSAVVWQRLDLLKRLVEHEPEIIHETDTEGKTLLHVACASGLYSHVAYLLSQKVNVNALDRRKWTPLMCAVTIQDENMVSLLLANGADCNCPYKYNSGIGPLRLAIEKHSLRMVELLVEAGAWIEFCVTLTMGSYGETGHRQAVACHNLATVAMESIDLLQPQSIDIALAIVQASPSAPDEDACLKVYEQFVRPSRRIRRSMSRELIHLIETISESTVDKIMRLLSLSFAVGVDLSKSNVERLTRKFRLTPGQDGRLFDLMHAHRTPNLRLTSSLSIRKQMIDAGNGNIRFAVNKADMPSFMREMLLLERW